MNMAKWDKDAQIFEKEHHDNCSICGRHFDDDEHTTLGFDKYKRLQYAGICCATQIDEIIVCHSYQKRGYTIPEKSNKLWRFMDLSKFISLLSTRKLYFARLDQFEDPFETAKGIIEREKEWNKFYQEFCFSAVKSTESFTGKTVSDEQAFTQSVRLLSELKHASINETKTTFASCWHENEFESEAMWKLYVKDLHQGVAIQTTFERLNNSLGKLIDIGRINYIDYCKQFVGINESFWYKRKSFEHENEVRAIIRCHGNKNEIYGILQDVDLDILIENVYISPLAGKWFEDIVNDLLNKYKLNVSICESNLLQKPFY